MKPDVKIYKIKIDINRVKNKMNKFLKKLSNDSLDRDSQAKNYERQLGINEKLNGFELLLIDKLGNIFKEKIYYNSSI